MYDVLVSSMYKIVSFHYAVNAELINVVLYFFKKLNL